MASKIPDSLFNEYLNEKIKLDIQTLKVQSLAKKLRALNAQGLEHPLLDFKANTSWRPNWQKIAKELVKKYMKPGPASVYMKNLRRRFPTTKGVAKIFILSKRYTEHQEKIQDLKAKYHLKEPVSE